MMSDIRTLLKQHFSDFTAAEIEVCVQFSQALRNKQAILFLGAGVSIPSGMMSGAQLVDEFRLRTGKDSFELRELCSHYEKAHGSHGLRRTLLQLLDDWNKPLSPLHRLIPRLDLRYLVTVNVDRLLEESCRQLRKPFVCFSMPEDLGYARSDILTILKIHGTLEHPHTLVFSHSDYQRVLIQDKEFEEKLKHLFQDNLVMTIGFTANEPDFNLLTDWLADRNDGKRVIALHIDKQQAIACKREGVFPLLIKDSQTTPSHQRLPILIGLLGGLPVESIVLENLVVNRRVNPFKRLESYRQEDAKHFVGREAFLANCFACIEKYRYVLLFGDSGCGKSSFVNAALEPHWCSKVNTHVTIVTVSSDLTQQWQALLLAIDQQKPALVVLDQFERFFDDISAIEQQRHFLTVVMKQTQAQFPLLKCLFVIRRDRIADLHPYKDIHPGLFIQSLELTRITASEAANILVHHFAYAGYQIEGTLVEAIVTHASSDDLPYLPALQLYGYAQFESAERARISGEIVNNWVPYTLSVVKENVLSEFVKEALNVFSTSVQHSLVLNVLKKLTLHGCRQQLKAEQLENLFAEPDKARAVLNTLVDRRLVVFVPEKSAWELVHDSLVWAIENGPLTIEPDYELSEIRHYLLIPEKWLEFSCNQIENLLRFSIKEKLPFMVWLNLCQQQGIDVGGKLVEYCRSSVTRMATNTIELLRQYPITLSAEQDKALRRLLLTIVEDAMGHEIEDQDKGREALLLLLKLGLDEQSLPFFLKYIDPFIDTVEGEPLEAFRSLNGYDYQMMDIYLPAVLKACSIEQLLKLGTQIEVSIQPFELGPQRYGLILEALVLRGALDEFLKRTHFVVEPPEDESQLFDPEMVLRVLARLPQDLPSSEHLGQLREILINVGIYAEASTDFHQAVLQVLACHGVYAPEQAMFQWVRFYSRYGKAGSLWPESKQVAATLLKSKDALRLFLQRMSSSRSTNDLAAFTDVLLAFEPNEELNYWYRQAEFDQYDVVSQLGYSLAQFITTDFVDAEGELVEQYDINHELMYEGYAPYRFWRAGQVIKARQKMPDGQKITQLEVLAKQLLDIGAKGLPQATFDNEYCDADEQQKYHVLDDYFNQYQADMVQKCRREAVRLFGDLPATLRNIQNQPEGAQIKVLELRNAVAALMVNHPHLESPIERWPPFSWNPVYFSEMKEVLKALQDIEALYPETNIPQCIHEVLSALRELERVVEADIGHYLTCYQWLKQNAAQIAAQQTEASYQSYFENLKYFTEDRTMGSQYFCDSIMQWTLGVPWQEAPWFMLYNDPREEDGGCEEEEAQRLLEMALMYSPMQVNETVRQWLFDYLNCGFEDDYSIADFANCAEPFAEFVRSDWGRLYADKVTTTAMIAMLESLYKTFQISALTLWPSCRLDELTDVIVDIALQGNKDIRGCAVEALNRKELCEEKSV